jgi:hypothetical protein
VKGLALEYPRDAAARISDLIRKRAEHRRKEWPSSQEEFDTAESQRRYVAPLPTVEEIGSLTDTAFLASVTREEGRDVAFRALFCDPAMAAASLWPLVVFNQSIPWSVEDIRKLSPACGHESTDIAVYRVDGALHIWGLLYVRRKEVGQRSAPTGFTVESHQAASIHATFDGEPVLMYSKSECTVPEVEGVVDKVDIRKIIAEALDEIPGFRERMTMASRLVDMANEALVSGHGATILLVPSGMSPRCLDAPRYVLATSTTEALEKAFLDLSGIAATRGVARLAFLDGALLIEATGKVRAAGAMILVQRPYDFPVVTLSPSHPKRKATECKLADFGGGARHRSALVFCFENPGAFALVVSHDGQLSICTRPLNEAVVVAIRPILRGTDIGI